MRKIISVILFAGLCAGCCGPNEVDAAAERARFEAIGPEYLLLVREARRADGTPWFQPAQVANREATVAEWESYVLDVERSVEGK